MIEKNKLEEYLAKCLTTGADFSEVFLEEKEINTITMEKSKIDRIDTNIEKGIGIRICKNNEKVYGYTNKLDDKSINSLIEKLIQSFNSKKIKDKVELEELQKYEDKIEIPHNKYTPSDKKKILFKIDKVARQESELVNQVSSKLYEYDQTITIANSSGLYKQDKRTLTRVIVTVYAKENEKITSSSSNYGAKKGYEFLQEIDIEKMTKELVKYSIEKLNALECPSGKLPVIIGNGFGGVIFHEACGHALEATSVSKDLSVFSNMLGKTIASPKVTLKDNAIIPNEWGSNNIDDEGNICKDNTLIEKGILKSYLIDNINNRSMNLKPTSSGRRESYKYSPVSRMSNTYLESGEDKIEDMIKSIKYGVYAKNMGGGSVDPATGDFNFGVAEAYLIKDGKISSPLKEVCLIGNGKEILKQVSMVSDDLKLASGMCGSASGWVPVTVGMPTIKVDSILVGGKGEKINEL